MTFVKALLLIVLWVAPAAAAEEHAAPMSQLWFPLINFVIFLYLLKRFLLPFLREYLSSRHRDIATAIDEAAEAQRQAETNGREIRERLAGIDEEATRMRLELRMEGESEKAKLLTEADHRALKLKADADFLAEQEVKTARQELRDEIARAAREAAAKAVQSHISEADQKRLVNDFVNGLGAAR